MADLVSTLRAIREGSAAQFAPLIYIPAAALSTVTDVLIELPMACTLLWLPPTVQLPNGQYTNPNLQTLGIRINRPDAPILSWSLSGLNVISFSGAVDRIFVRQLPAGAEGDVYLMAAREIGLQMTYESSSFGKQNY